MTTKTINLLITISLLWFFSACVLQDQEYTADATPMPEQNCVLLNYACKKADVTAFSRHMPDDEEIIVEAIIQCYSYHNSFLLDCDYIQDKIAPRHAQTMDQAQKYLEQGFAPDLAAAIAQTYTNWNQEKGQLLIIAQDALPFLTASDRPYLELRLSDDNTMACLQRDYVGCYMTDNVLRLRLTAKRCDLNWIITGIEFFSLPNSSHNE